MKKLRSALGVLLLLIAGEFNNAWGQPLWAGPYAPSFAKLRDTLYLLDTTYLEVRLDQQMIYHHFRSGRIDSYPCSTGDPHIKDGIATRPGIFTIQSKAKKAMSQEFQVYLNYWMGFDGGIGFHGLDGRSYYRHLGRRASSHGCVRISNETGTKLFGNVRNGTTVYVHGGSPARVIAFADSTTPGLRILSAGDADLLAARLSAVTSGQWTDTSLADRLALPRGKRLSLKVAVGQADPGLIVQYPLKVVAVPLVLPRSRPAPSRATFLSVQPASGDHDLSALEPS